MCEPLVLMHLLNKVMLQFVMIRKKGLYSNDRSYMTQKLALLLTTPVGLIAFGQFKVSTRKMISGWPSDPRSWHGSLLAVTNHALKINSPCPQKHMPAPTLSATHPNRRAVSKNACCGFELASRRNLTDF